MCYLVVVMSSLGAVRFSVNRFKINHFDLYVKNKPDLANATEYTHQAIYSFIYNVIKFTVTII